MRKKINDGILGVLIGDALGVPFEFKRRNSFVASEMIGYGTHNQKKGTWSDDGSMTMCLLDELTHGYDLQKISKSFVNWYYGAKWTARGKVFDIGNTTLKSITKIRQGISPQKSGSTNINENGNGSLMRILPLLHYIKDMSIGSRFNSIKEVSSITHAHHISVIACFYYLEFALLLLRSNDLKYIYKKLQTEIPIFLNGKYDLTEFDNLLNKDISKLKSSKIQSSGYVIHTLEASIWSLLKTNNFKDAILKAVNLGDDTDTIGAVTGGLSGIMYGENNIPNGWINNLARINDIKELFEKF